MKLSVHISVVSATIEEQIGSCRVSLSLACISFAFDKQWLCTEFRPRSVPPLIDTSKRPRLTLKSTNVCANLTDPRFQRVEALIRQCADCQFRILDLSNSSLLSLNFCLVICSRLSWARVLEGGLFTTTTIYCIILICIALKYNLTHQYVTKQIERLSIFGQTQLKGLKSLQITVLFVQIISFVYFVFVLYHLISTHLCHETIYHNEDLHVTYYVMFLIDHITPPFYTGFPHQLIASVIPLNLTEEIICSTKFLIQWMPDI